MILQAINTDTEENKVFWSILKSPLPVSYIDSVRRAVVDFYESSGILNLGVSKEGYVAQTMNRISIATNQPDAPIDFWVSDCGDGEIAAYSLCHWGIDIDNRLTYWIDDAWIRKDFRGKIDLRSWFSKMKDRARRLLCSHLMVVAGRNEKAYRKLFGLHPYSVILKGEL